MTYCPQCGKNDKVKWAYFLDNSGDYMHCSRCKIDFHDY